MTEQAYKVDYQPIVWYSINFTLRLISLNLKLNMIQTAFVSLLTASTLMLSEPKLVPTGSAQLQTQSHQAQKELGSASMSLDKRMGTSNPENIYKDNILLNLAYLSGKVNKGDSISWSQIREPFILQFDLEPGQRFAYHDIIDSKYNDNVVVTAHTNYGGAEGYKYSEGLYGMGVCHLASLIHWAALNADLESIAPSNHDFYAIPEIDKKYGVAIYASPDAKAASIKQNLYIKNTLDTKVTFKFDFDGDNLKVSILK
jgi:hypothetical protein